MRIFGRNRSFAEHPSQGTGAIPLGGGMYQVSHEVLEHYGHEMLSSLNKINESQSIFQGANFTPRYPDIQEELTAIEEKVANVLPR